MPLLGKVSAAWLAGLRAAGTVGRWTGGGSLSPIRQWRRPHLLMGSVCPGLDERRVVTDSSEGVPHVGSWLSRLAKPGTAEVLGDGWRTGLVSSVGA